MSLKMDLQSLYSMKSKFVTRAVGNELIVVPLTENVARMNELFTLNETGKFIWEQINETSKFDDIVSAMTEDFEIDSITAQNDLEAFLTKLSSLTK